MNKKIENNNKWSMRTDGKEVANKGMERTDYIGLLFWAVLGNKLDQINKTTFICYKFFF